MSLLFLDPTFQARPQRVPSAGAPTLPPASAQAPLLLPTSPACGPRGLRQLSLPEPAAFRLDVASNPSPALTRRMMVEVVLAGLTSSPPHSQ